MDRGSFARVVPIAWAAVFGCAFDSSTGANSASGVATDSDASATEVPPASTSVPDVTTDDAAPTESSDDDSSTSEGQATTTTGSGEPARVVVDDHDFGVLGPGAGDSAMLDVRNEGGSAAIDLAAMELKAPFDFVGGAYPGTGGTCEPAIAAGEGCIIAIGFTPPAFGSWQGEVVLTYKGGDEPDARGQLDGASAGTTGNLIVNGDAETGGSPPRGWMNIVGNWATRDDALMAHGGSRSINGGPFPDTATAQLQQNVVLTDYDTVVDAGELSYAFAGFGRSFAANDDPYQIVLVFLDDTGAALGNFDTGPQYEVAYQSLANTDVVPTGARTISVNLFCHKLAGGNCSAFFDDLSLTVSYVAP